MKMLVHSQTPTVAPFGNGLYNFIPQYHDYLSMLGSKLIHVRSDNAVVKKGAKPSLGMEQK